MAFNGSGTFNRLYNWVTDAANSVNITASRMDGEMDGFATGLSNCITKDGQTTVTADIPFNSNKLTGVADPAAAQDAATKTYVDGLTTSTVKAITDSDSPYSLVAGDKGKLVTVDSSSGSVTVNLLAAATAGDGYSVSFKRIAGTSNTITIDGNGSETIDGATTVTIDNDDQVLRLRCDGSDWQIDGSHDNDPNTYALQSISLTAGNGLTGGGDLSTNRSFAADYASQAEAEAGSDTTKLMTPQRTSQAITALAPAGGLTEVANSPYSVNSGDDILMDDIPSGTTIVEMAFYELDTNGSDNILIRLGPSGGVETTGYNSNQHRISGITVSTANIGSAIRLTRDNNSDFVSGTIKFMHMGSDKWSYTGSWTNDSLDQEFVSGNIELSGELDRFMFSTSGGNDFDNSGLVTILAA